jgi:hypothetical protein
MLTVMERRPDTGPRDPPHDLSASALGERHSAVHFLVPDRGAYVSGVSGNGARTADELGGFG